MKKGFTLIELMIAVSIIAILTAIGLAAYNQSRAVARDGKRISDIQEIQKALEQYYASNQTYPSSLTDASKTPTFPSYFQAGVAPSCDATNSSCSGNNYYYTQCLSGAAYTLCAKLENCGSKCTNDSALTDCTAVGAPAANHSYFCAANLSN